MRRIAPLLALALAGCASGGPKPPPPVAPPGPATISDAGLYLAQARCPDGMLWVLEQDCAGAAAQKGSDPILASRHDWGQPGGYFALDSVSLDNGAFATLWAFQPFGAFDATLGDGGEVYVVAAATTRISITQDGGKPYVQGFYGAGCGGTGWVAFRNDAPTGAWASVVARLSGLPVPSTCAATDPALTQYRLEQVSIPFLVDGVRRDITLPTVISEHYDDTTIDDSSDMERSFFAAGVGRAVWEAWSKNPPAGAGLDQRCPGTSWSSPPAPGWRLSDCRFATNVVSEDGTTTANQFGWPPIGEVLP